jgi:uncharacterized membrane protein YhfC
LQHSYPFRDYVYGLAMAEMFEDVRRTNLLNRVVRKVRKGESLLTIQTVDVGEPSDFL